MPKKGIRLQSNSKSSAPQDLHNDGFVIVMPEHRAAKLAAAAAAAVLAVVAAAAVERPATPAVLPATAAAEPAVMARPALAAAEPRQEACGGLHSQCSNVPLLHNYHVSRCFTPPCTPLGSQCLRGEGGMHKPGLEKNASYALMHKKMCKINNQRKKKLQKANLVQRHAKAALNDEKNISFERIAEKARPSVLANFAIWAFCTESPWPFFFC